MVSGGALVREVDMVGCGVDEIRGRKRERRRRAASVRCAGGLGRRALH